jgi:hypothetical protein
VQRVAKRDDTATQCATLPEFFLSDRVNS